MHNGLPMTFGFACFSSLVLADNRNIPFQHAKEDVGGGHTVMLACFDDNPEIPGPATQPLLPRVRLRYAIHGGRDGLKGLWMVAE